MTMRHDTNLLMECLYMDGWMDGMDWSLQVGIYTGK